MNNDEMILAFSDLRVKFSDREYVRKADLRQFYLLQNPNLTEKAFRRILYSLEKQNIIISIGAGIYAFLHTSHPVKKRKFIPNLSPSLYEMSSKIKEDFPYIQYLSWETNILNEFMIHQPNQSQVILEIEKDACESVFNRLKENPSINIFLEPSKSTFDRYIFNTSNSVILLSLVTQSPRMKIKGITTARLEKILVDIFADKDRFFIFHGQEMINIFENAFSSYWINPKTLFRYSGRRKVSKELKSFITKQTEIELSLLYGETK